MEHIWEVLGLEPTYDSSATKRAYAQKSLTCHPEEDPEGFLQLRRAYQAALDYAEGKQAPAPEEAEPPDIGAPEDEGWTLAESPAVWDEGPNPYTDHEAVRSFLELYTGKQRKDGKKWLDYFTSGEIGRAHV